jgi:hypothetical protein
VQRGDRRDQARPSSFSAWRTADRAPIRD